MPLLLLALGCPSADVKPHGSVAVNDILNPTLPEGTEPAKVMSVTIPGWSIVIADVALNG